MLKKIIKETEDYALMEKKSGMKYLVRKDRHRYFFPEEWTKFIDSITNLKHKLFFECCLFTGGRVMEILHLKPENFSEDNVITFKVVKHRVAKKRSYTLKKDRSFFVSKKLTRKIKKYCLENEIDSKDYIFLDNSKLPLNYNLLPNKEKSKHYRNYKVNYYTLLKRRLKKIGIEDVHNFSLHNIRKTYGNWMKVFIDINELCFRMGHDMETFQENYGSSMVFTEKQKLMIQKIFGDIK